MVRRGRGGTTRSHDPRALAHRILRRLAPRRGARRAAPLPAETETERQAFLDRVRTATPFVAVEVGELLFFVSPSDRLGRSVFVQRGRQDFDVLARVLRLLEEHGVERPGVTLVEVGANIGTTTVCALRRHGFERVVALEPEPGNFRLLGLNLAANDVVRQVTAIQAAATDRDGQVLLQVSRRSSGLHTTVLTGGEGDADGETIHVDAVTLDALASGGVLAPDEVGLLWLDAAGAETAALAGASLLLARHVPLVTAVRPLLPNWPGVRADLHRLLAGYTRFAEVRGESPVVTDDLEAVLASVTRAADIVAFGA